MQTPTNRSEVRTLLGFIGHYRIYIPTFADITAPLCDLTAEGHKNFAWEEIHEAAFTAIKTALSSQPVLALPLLQENFILYSDASMRGIGGVVAQVQPLSGSLGILTPPSSSGGPGALPLVGVQKPIAFFSRKLTPAETRYSVTELELLAIVF